MSSREGPQGWIVHWYNNRRELVNDVLLTLQEKLGWTQTNIAVDIAIGRMGCLVQLSFNCPAVEDQEAQPDQLVL